MPAQPGDNGGEPLSGTLPLTVTFTDTTVGDFDSWFWTFGDGGTSTAQHPNHMYTVSGTYTVSLTVDGPLGSDTETKPGYVTVWSGELAPNADFTGTPTERNAPLSVSFTDTSTADIDTWLWTFGDGGTSSDQNPTHVYPISGTYTVTLTVGERTFYQ